MFPITLSQYSITKPPVKSVFWMDVYPQDCVLHMRWHLLEIRIRKTRLQYEGCMKVRCLYMSVYLCCLGQYRCTSLCSSLPFHLGIWAKDASQTHSGGQHFIDIESVCVGWGGGGDPCCPPSGQMAGLYASMVATEERGHRGMGGSSADRQRGHLQTQVILSR